MQLVARYKRQHLKSDPEDMSKYGAKQSQISLRDRLPFILSRPNRRIEVIQWLVIVCVCIVGLYYGVDKFIHWYYLPTYASKAEENFRSRRFPSVDERVRIYMSNWYLPPCDDDGKVIYSKKPDRIPNSNPLSLFNYTLIELASPDGARQSRVFSVANTAEIKRMFYLEQGALDQCFERKELSIRYYCLNSAESILAVARNAIWMDDELPILCQFSDETESSAWDVNGTIQINPRVPHIKKIRYAMSRNELYNLTRTPRLTDNMTYFKEISKCVSGPRRPPSGLDDLQPIIWLLNIDRHFKMTRMVRWWDRGFESKKNQAVFRGLLTGLEYNKNATDDENCQNLVRCRFVYRHSNSNIIDAKLTSTFNKLPPIYRGVNLTGETMHQKDLLSFKGIIILEGNDVSSGLKWAMVSKSVVLMRRPRYTSWAMEELLEPWVHYIPLNDDFTDVEERVQWMLNHPEESKRISHRANLWILDLFYHPDAMKDNRLINEEVLRRYTNHFASANRLTDS